LSGIAVVMDGHVQGNVAVQASIHFDDLSFGYLEIFGYPPDLLWLQIAIL
jgi:hypothetical protein